MTGKRSTILTLSRSGGVAGIRPPPLVLDSGKLTPKLRERVEALLEKSEFFSLPCELPAPKGMADSFQHSLSVQHADGRNHSVTFDESSASEPLRELKRLVRDSVRAT